MAKSLSPEIKAALVKDITTIHEILIEKHNPSLFTKIIETSFLIHKKQAYGSTLSDLAEAQYPDPNTVPRGWELMKLIADLAWLICGTHELMIQEIKLIEKDKQQEYYDTRRVLVEQEIREIALSFKSDSEDVSLIGDVG